MAHLIMDDNRFVERMVAAGPAWHKLGTVFANDADLTVADAVRMAGADFEIVKIPAYGQFPDGSRVDIGKSLIYRMPHTFKGATSPGAILSPDPVGDGYTVIQNQEIAAMLEPVAKKWKIETCGALQDGKTLFIALDGGEFDIHGDPNHMYFVISDTKDGKKALSLDCTPVRVVCANTLRTGLKDASFKIRIAHDGARALDDLSYWTEVIPQIAATAQRTKEALTRLADVEATPDMVTAIVEAAFPPPVGSERIKHADLAPLSLSEPNRALLERDYVSLSYNLQRITGIQTLARESVDLFNQANPALAGTLYAVANGVNEVAMWRKGHDGTIEESAVFGTRAQESARAFRKAFTYC